MKTCEQCLMENTPETRFCRGCGAPLTATKTVTLLHVETLPVEVVPNPYESAKPAIPAVPNDEFARRLGSPSRALWGTLAIASVLLIGGFGWLLGRTREVVAPDPATFASEDSTSATEGDASAPEPESSDPEAAAQTETSASSGAQAQQFLDCTATASRYIRSVQGNQYQPSVILDGDKETAWNAENSRHGVGEWVQLAWSGERSVSRVGIIVGYDKRSTRTQYSDDPWMWNRNNRLRRATLLFSNGGKIAVTFDDTPQMQYREFSPVRCQWVRVIVDDVYLDKYDGTDPKWDDIALSEAEVWGTTPASGGRE